MSHHSLTTLEQLVELAARRVVHENQHFVLGVYGRPGTGKTSLRALLAKKMQARINEMMQEKGLTPRVPRFTPTEHVAASEAQMCLMGKRLGHYVVLQTDESGKGGDRRRAMSTGNVDVSDHMDKTRKWNQVYIFNRITFQHWDPRVSSHFMWTLETSRLGWFIAKEVFRNRDGSPREVVRFDGPFPDCAKVDPELWREMDALAFKAARDEDPERTLLREETRRRYRQAVRWAVSQ